MSSLKDAVFHVDKENRKITVERKFDAKPELVWKAWTEPAILDQWWAPEPWKAETKTMKFEENGYWHYAMVGPEGEKHWALLEFDKIDPGKSYSGKDAFADENRKVNEQMPRSNWENHFSGSGDQTSVNIEITFDRLEDLEGMIEMGFKEGFNMGMQNLDRLLAEKKVA